MSKDNIIEERIVDCTISLGIAVQQSGGTVNPRFLTMTLKQFIAEVAGPNNIKFIYEKEKE